MNRLAPLLVCVVPLSLVACGQSTTERPSDSTSTVNPGAGNPGAGNPGAGNPGAGDTSAGNPGTGDPGTSDPGSDSPFPQATCPPGSSCSDAGFPQAVAVDSAGNILVVGEGPLPLNFGAPGSVDAGGTLYVAKLDPTGKQLWARGYGEGAVSGGAYRVTVATDAENNIALAGEFAGKGNFEGLTIKALGQDDAIVLKLNPQGDLIWARSFGSAETSMAEDFDGTIYEVKASTVCTDIAIDSSGAIVVSGHFSMPTDFGDGLLNPANGGAFVIKLLGEDGSTAWIRQQTSATPKVATDPENAVLIASHPPIFDEGGLFLTKLDADATELWQRWIPADFDPSADDVGADASGNFVIAGSFMSSVDLGDGVLESGGEYDGYIFKVAPDGSTLWSRRFGGKGFTANAHVAIDSEGASVLSVECVGGEVSMLNVSTTNKVGTDLCLVRVDAAGTPLSALAYGSNGHDENRGLALTPDGKAVVAAMAYDAFDPANVYGYLGIIAP
jgi:hypothetical protein